VMLPSSSIEPKSTSPEETGASLTGFTFKLALTYLEPPSPSLPV